MKKAHIWQCTQNVCALSSAQLHRQTYNVAGLQREPLSQGYIIDDETIYKSLNCN